MHKEKNSIADIARCASVQGLVPGAQPVSVEDRLAQLGDRFKFMGIAPYTDEGGDGTLIVTVKVHIPAKWDVYEDENAEKFKVGIASEPVPSSSMNEVTFFIDITYGIDRVFQAILNTVEKNRKEEEKMKIYQEKADALRKMYEESVEKLTEMFNGKGDDLDSLREADLESLIAPGQAGQEKPSEASGGQEADKLPDGTEKGREKPGNAPGKGSGKAEGSDSSENGEVKK